VTVSGSTNNTGTLTASPTSGAAPLSVSFSYQGSPSQTYRINFGDGQSDNMYGEVPPGGSFSGIVGTTHTYTATGTYTATLLDSNGKNIGAVTVVVN
jgi:PKD repeat protein